jgi:hypothetical protein
MSAIRDVIILAQFTRLKSRGGELKDLEETGIVLN